jgi:hypothetical protein
MALKASSLRTIREWHLYMGLLFAPMLLLFSVSGALQTFRLPDAKTAPGWMIWMASVHKDQVANTAAKPERPKGPPPARPPGDSHDEAPKRAKPHKLPLQIFVTLLAIGLAFSTLLGVTIALNSRSTRRVSIILLIVGTLLPLGLLYL